MDAEIVILPPESQSDVRDRDRTDARQSARVVAAAAPAGWIRRQLRTDHEVVVTSHNSSVIMVPVQWQERTVRVG